MHTLLSALVARGHEVQVVLTDSRQGGDPYVLDGVRVHPFRDNKDAQQAVLGESPPDVLVTHLRSTPQATILGELYRLPVVHVLHNDNQNERSWMTRGPRLVVYNSEWVQVSCLDWWGQTQDAPPPSSIVVRPPVLAENYRTTPGARVTLINLSANKGGSTFWKLAARMPDVPFLAVKGAYGEQIVKGLRNVDVQHHVPGHRMREAAYARTRLLLMPSSYESWGRTAVEAMCSGIPVVAHPTPGLMECLGNAGTFVDRDDLDGWELQIRRLLQPRGWAAASRKAELRAAELNPDEDLRRWVAAVEAVMAGAV
jgi:glycosyltransferase involved in cell wall biosynthesis